MSAKDFVHGFNISVEEGRQELTDMIDDLLEIEENWNKVIAILKVENAKDFDEVISLLKEKDKQIVDLENEIETLHGELREAYADYGKLKKLWKSLEELCGHFMIPVEGKRTLIKKLMVDLEIDNEYFPGEEK